MAAAISALWPAAGTTNRARKAILRWLADHVVVYGQRASADVPRTNP